MGMAMTGWDSRYHGIASPDARARVEPLLALARVCPLPVLLVALISDVTVTAIDRTLAGDLIAAYTVVCAVVLGLALKAPDRLIRAAPFVQAVDTALTVALMYLMAPAAAPLVLVVFVLVAAAARWGARASLATGGIALAAFVAAALVDGGAAFTAWRVVAYGSSLVALALIVTALAGQVREYFVQRDVLARGLANIGTASSFAEALRRCLAESLAYLGAPRAVLAVEDLATRRGYLWRIDGYRDVRPTVEEMAGNLKPHYFGDWSPGLKAWFARRGNGRLIGEGLSGTGHPCTLSPAEGALAGWLFSRHQTASVMATETVLREWRVRLLAFDTAAPLPSDALRFLRLFVEQAAPLLRQDYDVRSLRSRVGSTERARVARELHDGPIQSLIGLDLEIEAIRRHAEHSPIQMAHLAGLRDGLRQCISDARDLMMRLRPAPMSGDDVLRLIAELAVRLRRENGLDVRLVSSVAHLDCSSRTCRHLTRIVQEALMNVRKHSGAHSVTITLSQNENSWRLSIEDDGRGFGFAGRLTLDQLDRTDLGPKQIRERVHAMHGELTIRSQPGAGANIEVDWPRGAYV